MKVVILNNDFRVYWKGRLQYLKKYLKARDIDFFAIELFGKGSPYSFDLYENKAGWWNCLFPQNNSAEISNQTIQTSIFAALDEINPDFVIASSIVFYAGAIGLRWAKKNKKKFIMFDDARPGQVKRMFLVQWIKDLLTKQADGLWYPSKIYGTDFSRFYNDGIYFFYGFNCIDNDFFKKHTEQESNQRTIICVARLVPIKNIDSLLRAWCAVEKVATGYRLIIIGDGPEYDNLIGLRATLNLHTVDFVGVVYQDNLAKYYHMSEAFVLPSVSETWGLVVNEAMAAGLPILLSNGVNAGKDLLMEGVTGISFDPMDINSIANAICTYINLDIAVKKTMSANALQAISLMSYEKMGHQLTEALHEINNRKPRRPGFLASFIIKFWNGRYNTTGWDKK